MDDDVIISILVIGYPVARCIHMYILRVRNWLRTIRAEIDAINIHLERDPVDWLAAMEEREPKIPSEVVD